MNQSKRIQTTVPLRNISSVEVNRSNSASDAPSTTPYQVDFSTLDGGKRVKASKRYARWLFGFCDNNAMMDGKTGAACRGNEHEIVLAWSVSSGKCAILLDGEVIYNSTDRAEKIKFSQLFFGKSIEIVAYLSDKERPVGAREFDLSFSGTSFFSLPRIFELGYLDASAFNNTRKAKSHASALRNGVSGRRRRQMNAE